MFDERLFQLLENNYSLLNKPAIYMSKEEKWSILQAILYLFGAEFQGNKIILFFQEEQEMIIKELGEKIQSILGYSFSFTFNKEEKYWEITPIL